MFSDKGSTIFFFFFSPLPILLRPAPATQSKGTCQAAAPMFISVPFDQLHHFLIAPGFQVGAVGGDGAIPQLRLKPFPRQFRDAVFDL